MKRKEGGRGRTLKTHSRRPGARRPPQLQWGSYGNETFTAPPRSRRPPIHILHFSHTSIRQLCSSEKQVKWVTIAGVKKSGNLTSGLTSPIMCDLNSPLPFFFLLSHRFLAGEKDHEVWKVFKISTVLFPHPSSNALASQLSLPTLSPSTPSSHQRIPIPCYCSIYLHSAHKIYFIFPSQVDPCIPN